MCHGERSSRSEANQTFTEMMIALAVLDLPESAPETDFDYVNDSNPSVVASLPVQIVYDKDLNSRTEDEVPKVGLHSCVGAHDWSKSFRSCLENSPSNCNYHIQFESPVA